MAQRNNYAVSTNGNGYAWINLNRKALVEGQSSTLMFDIKYNGFYPGASDSVHTILGRAANDSDEGRFGIFIHSDNRVYFFQANANPTTVELGNYPALGRYITITVTKNKNNQLSFYFDNHLMATLQGSSKWPTSNTIIGKYNNATSGVANSPIATYDNIKIFNYELSPDEVAHYAKRYMEGTERGLTCLFQFEDGSGTTVTDKSPSKINGILTNMTYVPAEVDLYAYKILLSSRDGSYKSILLETKSAIPGMNSNSDLNGTAISNGTSSSFHNYNAFDGNINTSWTSLNNTNYPHYIGYDFAISRIINRYVVQTRNSDGNDLTSAPKNWTFEGSNDGFMKDVHILDVQTGITWSMKGERKEFKFSNVTKYKQYRLSIAANNGYSGGAVSVGELEMYELPRLLSLSSATEDNFINYGTRNPHIGFPVMGKVTNIVDSTSPLGSGKTFEHTVDLSKRRVDKIILE